MPFTKDTAGDPQTHTDREGAREKRSNAQPNFQIVHEMRGAIKQQIEEPNEKSSSHFATSTGRNAIETLEKQDDRQEIHQREDQCMLKVQLDSSEECDEHLEVIAQAVMDNSEQENEEEENRRKKQERTLKVGREKETIKRMTMRKTKSSTKPEERKRK